MVSLRGREQFQRVMTEGGRGRSGPVAVTVAPGEGTDALRLGFAVSVHGPGRAVRRNRVRRRLRAAARETGLRGRHIIVRGDERVLEAEFQKLVEHLCLAVRRAEARR